MVRLASATRLGGSSGWIVSTRPSRTLWATWSVPASSRTPPFDLRGLHVNVYRYCVVWKMWGVRKTTQQLHSGAPSHRPRWASRRPQRRQRCAARCEGRRGDKGVRRQVWGKEQHEHVAGAAAAADHRAPASSDPRGSHSMRALRLKKHSTSSSSNPARPPRLPHTRRAISGTFSSSAARGWGAHR